MKLQILLVQMEEAIQAWETSELNFHFSSHSSLICLPEQPGQTDRREGEWQSQSEKNQGDLDLSLIREVFRGLKTQKGISLTKLEGLCLF